MPNQKKFPGVQHPELRKERAENWAVGFDGLSDPDKPCL